jgi:hypothetical protein
LGSHIKREVIEKQRVSGGLIMSIMKRCDFPNLSNLLVTINFSIYLRSYGELGDNPIKNVRREV